MSEEEFRKFIHDLNNKLASVQGYLDVLKITYGEDVPYLVKLQKSVENLNNFIQNTHAKK